MRFIAIAAAAVALISSACTSISVREIPGNEPVSKVLVVTNPRVQVDDLHDVIVNAFERHGISARTVTESTDPLDNYVVTYSARRSWDMSTYMSEATVTMRQSGRTVATANYYLNMGGGLSLSKYNSTKEKMNPVLDEMLKNFVTAKPAK